MEIRRIKMRRGLQNGSDQYQSLFATPLAIFRFLDENHHNN